MPSVSFTIPDISKPLQLRNGETKLGERVGVAEAENWQRSIQKNPARFVWLGLAEDVGVRANLGIGGAATTPEAALKALLNIQETDTLPGHSILVGGLLKAEMPADSTVEELRNAVSEIDKIVAEKAAVIISSGKIPIVIGGGHNNCFGLLEGACKTLGVPLAALNLDAHSDYRSAEGRHSGNGFRYAHQQGFLERYAAIGLHRNYNSQNLIQEMITHPDLLPLFYEDFCLSEYDGFERMMDKAFEFTGGRPTGIELDLDCIEDLLSSAMTPAGITMREARRYLIRAAAKQNAIYLHLPEGVVKREDGLQSATVAKALTFLTTDFMRAILRREA